MTIKSLIRLKVIASLVAERNAYLDNAEPFPKDPELRKIRGQRWDNEGTLEDLMEEIRPKVKNPSKLLDAFEKDPRVKKLGTEQKNLTDKYNARIDSLVDKVKEMENDKRDMKHFLRKESRH